MARNEHKKDLRQLSEAYQNVISEGAADDLRWADDEDLISGPLDYPLEDSDRWENSDHLADVLEGDGGLVDFWREGEYGDADKESLKAYINQFIDEQLRQDKDLTTADLGEVPLKPDTAGKWHGARDASLQDQGWHAPQE